MAICQSQFAILRHNGEGIYSNLIHEALLDNLFLPRLTLSTEIPLVLIACNNSGDEKRAEAIKIFTRNTQKRRSEKNR
jgi:hypothetical protein